MQSWWFVLEMIQASFRWQGDAWNCGPWRERHATAGAVSFSLEVTSAGFHSLKNLSPDWKCYRGDLLKLQVLEHAPGDSE